MSDDHGLRRDLGLFDTAAVVVGACVGVGIFFTPARVAALAGDASAAMLAWAIGGLVALAGAFTLAELGAMYPRSGGQYAALRDAYGSGVAFVHVVCNATAIQTGAIALIALVCAHHVALCVHGRGLDPVAASAGATVLIAVLGLANAAGVRWGARIQNVTVVAKLLALVAVAALAPRAASTTVWSSSPSGVGPGLLAAMVPALFSFGGWQQVTWIAGEVRDAERVLPRAIVVGVVVIVGVYLGVNAAYLHMLGHAGAAASDAIAADAVATVLGDVGRRVIAGIVAISAFGVLGAQLLSGPRLLYALASDGRFFAPLARVHADRGTPVVAIATMVVISLALLWAAGSEGVDRLLTGVVALDGVFFAATGLASVVLWRRRPRSERPVRMPAWPWLPIAFAVAELAIVVGATIDPRVRGAVWIGAGFIVVAATLYLVRFRRVR